MAKDTVFGENASTGHGQPVTLPSRSTKKEVDATIPSRALDVEQENWTADGEGYPPGSRYSATLRERENKSLNRNAGPGRPSANDGKIPTVGMGTRKTGRI